jgi:hypothetical protein
MFDKTVSPREIWHRGINAVNHIKVHDVATQIIQERPQRAAAPATASRPALGPTQPPVQWVPGGRYPGAGRRRPGRDAVHPPPPFCAVVKNEQGQYFLFLQGPRCRVVGQLYFLSPELIGKLINDVVSTT